MNQIILGEFTDDVTLLGTGGQLILGFTGLDAPMDIRDISHNFMNWEWTWSHAGITLLNGAAFFPIVGILKYGDEVALVAKSGNKADEIIAVSNSVDNIEDIVDAGKKADDVVGAVGELGTWKKTNESMSEASRNYQKYITGAEDGMVYNVNGVKFDGFKDGVLIEAKGNYSNFVDKKSGEFTEWFTGKKVLIDQAKRQTKAANGSPVQWYFNDEVSMNAMKGLLEEKVEGIEFILKPMP